MAQASISDFDPSIDLKAPKVGEDVEFTRETAGKGKDADEQSQKRRLEAGATNP